MGTRHLTCVFLDGEYKVAQYGQWDGYPAGQGRTCLEFLQKHGHGEDLERFKRHVRNCFWITAEEVEKINTRIREDKEFGSKWQDVYPELSRDTGAEILETIYNANKDVIKLNDDLSFAADSLFCEWVWVVDLDKGTFEAYKGFNHTPLDEDERFYHFGEDENGTMTGKRAYSGDVYYPVRLVGCYKLDDLPDVDDMINELDPPEQEDEEEEEA